MFRRLFLLLLNAAFIMLSMSAAEAQENTLLAPIPSPRGYHYMTFDIESNRVIIFGGLTMTSLTSFDIHKDTWAYDIDTNNWTLMSPTQSPANSGPLAYDAQSDRIILFLGGDWPLKSFRETWAYDFNTDTWTNMKPETAPPAVLGGNMVYDSESDRMILFSGLDVVNSIAPNKWVFPNDTWAYDYESNTWTKTNPEVSPSGRNYHAMAYDARSDRVILFGGTAPADNPDGAEALNDTWAYDYNNDTWTALRPVEAPLARDYSAMVYSARLNQVILFGGMNEFRGQKFSDSWAYDFTSNIWSELYPAVSPSDRGWHKMAYSPSTDQIVLFGGGVDRQHFDAQTWIYDSDTNTWVQTGH